MVGALLMDCCINISLEMSDGWVSMLLLRSIRLSSVGLSKELKIALFPFLGLWCSNLRNLVIAFFIHIRECFVMRARACFWAFLPMLPSVVIHSSNGGLVGGWYRGVEVVRDGLCYRM